MECNSSSSNSPSFSEDSTNAVIPEKRSKKTDKRIRTYSFSNEWEEEMFQIAIDKDTCYCLLCGKQISIGQKRNHKRHFDIFHAEVDHSHPLGSALRAEKVQQLKVECAQRCEKIKAGDIVSTNPHDCTLASFDIAFRIAQAMKPFTDGEFVKSLIIAAATRWFPDIDYRREFVNIVENTHLSPTTITRRVNLMADNVHEQLKVDLKKCVCFSIQLDESTDKTDTAQLVVMIRFVLENGSVQEELLELIPLTGETTGLDVYLSLKNSILAHEVPLEKLVAITTDGAPSMTGKITGFIGQCLRDPDFPRFLSFHCIIHQEVLCGETLNIKAVFEVVKKIINSIRARTLQHRLFKLMLENASAEFADLLLLNEVRWLSAGEVVFRFFKLLPEIIAFLESRGEHCEELYDSAWILDLAFLADILKEMNVLNKTLQLQQVAVWTSLQWINQFKNKIDRWISILQRRAFTGEEFKNFQHAVEKQNIVLSPEVGDRYLEILKDLKKDFEKRFQDFDVIKPICNYLTNPLMGLQVPYMEELCNQMSKLFMIDENKAVNEMIRLSTASWAGTRCEDFWKHLEFSEYPNLVTVFHRITSIYGTTCRCECMFSLMNHIKSETRSSINDGNLNDVMRLAVTNYTPDIDALAQKVRSYTIMH